jgi:hypothetical protein
MKSADVDRLLRSAGQTQEPDSEIPFGFETSVVARWRSGQGAGSDFADLSRFLRGAGAIACGVVVIAGAAAWRQYREETRFASLATNEYAIADSAIQTEFSQ